MTTTKIGTPKRLKELKATHTRSKRQLDEPAHTLAIASEIAGYEQCWDAVEPVIAAAEELVKYARASEFTALRDALKALELEE